MSIVNLYENVEIFITGGSGFVGKALIEKILRDLPNFSKIYVLLRSKKKQNPEERLQHLLKTPTFHRAFAAQPDSFKRIVAIAGDCQEIGLGISSSDLRKIQNVSLIFHMAASVRFDDFLKIAILQNTRGTHELLKIAEKLPNLKAFIHVSTLYAYPDIYSLEEKIYPPYADWRITIKLAETYDTETLNILFPKYAQSHPNTYSFTKSLSEQVINDYRHKLPVAICRPSVVFNAICEPFPGWIDNLNSGVGLFLAGAAGIIRTSYGDPDTVVNFVPVDICTMAFILAAFKLVTNPQCDGELEVFNFCNPTTASWTLQDFIQMGAKLLAKYPLENMLWFPSGIITRCFAWYYIRVMLLQFLPSAVFDSVLYLANKTPFLLKVQRRLYSSQRAVEVYGLNEWIFRNEKMKALDFLILEEERCLLSFMRYANLDKEQYYVNWIKGSKEFLLKENSETSEKAILRYKTMKYVHRTLQLTGGFYILRFLLKMLGVLVK